MDERRPPSSRDGGELRRTGAQSRDGYRQAAPQSRDGSRQAVSSQSRGGSRQAGARSGGGDRPRRQTPSRRNDVIRCENCGEDYSINYKRCPFCDERPSRGGVTGKRVANTRGGGYGRPASALKTATWIASFVVVLIAMFIVYRFMGAPLFGGNKNPGSGSVSTSGSQTPGGSTSGAGSGGDVSSTPVDPVPPAVQSIALGKTEVTLNAGGTEQLTANLLPAGAEGEVTWSSSNDAVATVSADGLVTNVNTGSSSTQVTITASCGDVTAEATVYCKPSGGGTTASGGQQGKVVNAEKGVNIRSGPGTDYDKVASASNGAKVTVLGEENGWYKVQYKNNKTGYIRKDYISIG